MPVLIRIGTGILLLLAAIAAPAAAADAPAASAATNLTVSAAEIKAVFLYNFTRFVKWPDKVFTDNEAPFVIGVQDTEPLRDSLQPLEKKTAQGRPIRIRYCRSPDDVAGCHVLFVNAADARDRKPLLEKAAGLPILTVGDAETFLDEGGMVRFVRRGENLRNQIRPDRARQAGLDPSARLLQIAEVILDDKR